MKEQIKHYHKLGYSAIEIASVLRIPKHRVYKTLRVAGLETHHPTTVWKPRINRGPWKVLCADKI